MSHTITVGIVQASPVFMNLDASVARAVELIERAAQKGAKLIAFGETWLPGYPAWLDYSPNAALWNHEPTKLRLTRLGQSETINHELTRNHTNQTHERLMVFRVVSWGFVVQLFAYVPIS